MKLGANSALFGGFDMETAFKYTAMAGYDGIELSAIPSMSAHLVMERWQELVPEIKQLAQTYGLDLLAMEQPVQSPERMERAFQAAVEIGIPVILCGPRGTAGDEDSFQERVELLGDLSLMAERYGVTLCVKPHVGAAIYNTATMLRAMEAISSPAFGINFDPSHIYRGRENPVEALAAVISCVKHVHIRDCKERVRLPGAPVTQTNGRGDIDLVGCIRVLREHGYAGAVDLEICGIKSAGYTMSQCIVIAAEARGHMQACLQACGAR